MNNAKLRISGLELCEEGWLLRFNGDENEFQAMLQEMRFRSPQGVYWNPNAFGKGGWFIPYLLIFEFRNHFYNFDEMLQKVKDNGTWKQKAYTFKSEPPPPRQEPPPPPKAPKFLIPKTVEEALNSRRGFLHSLVADNSTNSKNQKDLSSSST